jgi:hypothetical protein
MPLPGPPIRIYATAPALAARDSRPLGGHARVRRVGRRPAALARATVPRADSGRSAGKAKPHPRLRALGRHGGCARTGALTYDRCPPQEWARVGIKWSQQEGSSVLSTQPANCPCQVAARESLLASGSADSQAGRQPRALSAEACTAASMRRMRTVTTFHARQGLPCNRHACRAMHTVAPPRPWTQLASASASP